MTPQIATVTVNAAVDVTYLFDRFTHGGINRAARVEAVAGGKGNNVARVLARLGRPVIATGFARGRAGAFIEESLRADGVNPAFFHAAGESRTCPTLVDAATGVVTEIREPGTPVSPADGDAFLEALPKLIGSAEIVVLSGSLLPGLAADYYARLIRIVKDAGCRVVLDTSGPPLNLALAAHPDAIKPNRDELADLTGARGDEAVLVETARMLARQRLGAGATVLLTLGERGAVLAKADRAMIARPPAAEIVNPVSAGDALLAGYVDALADGAADEAALARAVATGTAAATETRMGVVDPATVARFRELVTVETREPVMQP